jgi:hypothetical protein
VTKETLEVASDIHIAWATGVFEGEGCIAYNRGTPELHVDMTDEDILRRVMAIFGGNVTGPYARGKNKPIYSWRLSGIKPVQEILDLMWPLLGERRRARAEEMLAQYHAAPVYRRRGRGERAAGVLPPRLETSKYQRYRARKDGLDVPKRKPGPKPGNGRTPARVAPNGRSI